MDAIVLWREAALAKGPQASSRPVSPVVEEDRQLATAALRSEEALSETSPLLPPQTPVKPSSSSWVRWWSRSRQADTSRPELRTTSSAPPEVVRELHHVTLLFLTIVMLYAIGFVKDSRRRTSGPFVVTAPSERTQDHFNGVCAGRPQLSGFDTNEGYIVWVGPCREGRREAKAICQDTSIDL